MTKIALVTGTAGLIGSHLVERLRESCDSVAATFHTPTINLDEITETFDLQVLNVTDFDAVYGVMSEIKPTEIYHLAAQSLPTVSWEDPWRTFDVNINGTVNVFEAVKRIRAARPDYDPVVVVACSSAEYGASMTPDRIPVDEEAPLLPLHPYGVSKVGQDLLAFQYWQGDRIRSIRARIFNCSGPRKRNDVASDFASRIAKIMRSGGTLRVGNLETRRAITDVRDTVKALTLLAEKGRPGEAYNICAASAVSIAQVLDIYRELAGTPIVAEQDPALLRPTDEAIIIGSSRKLIEHTGWEQTYTLRQTLADILAYELKNLEG